MATPRRLYIYLVSAISLQAFAWAIIDILRGLLIAPFNPNPISLAWHIAIILVSLPVFLVHWLWGQRLANRDKEEREASLRALYLYGMQASFLAPIIMSAFGLLTTILLWITGEPPRRHYPQLSTGEAILFYIVPLIVMGLLWYYHQRIIQQDSREVQIKGGAATIRRLYILAFSAVGLTMTSMGFIYILRALMFLLGGGAPVGVFSSVGFLSDVARLIVGVPLWLIFWLWAQRLFLGGEEEERQSALRKFYLYAVIFVAVISTATSVTFILQGLFSRLLVGASTTTDGDIRIPISIIVTMIILWVYHSRVLKDDIKVAEEIERQAGLRRLYYYLIAGIGLTAFVVGLSGVLSVAIRSLDQVAFGTGLREQLSWFIALTVTGLPVWYLPWNQVQVKATSTGAGGMGERRSLVRRIYIYFFIFVSTITMLSSVVYIMFRLISMILGEPLPTLSDLGQPIAFSLIALGVWLYHWSVLSKDRNLSKKEERTEFADTSVVVVEYGDHEYSQNLLEELRRANLGLKLVSLDFGQVTSEATSAKDRENALTQVNEARIIIGPWEMVLPIQEVGVTSTDMVNAVANSSAAKLLAPTRPEGWEWVGVEPWNTEFFVHQTVNAIKQIIANNVVKPIRPLGAGAIIGIIIGVIFLLLLLGTLIEPVFEFLF
jgi:hypothetical protein